MDTPYNKNFPTVDKNMLKMITTDFIINYDKKTAILVIY